MEERLTFSFECKVLSEVKTFVVAAEEGDVCWVPEFQRVEIEKTLFGCL